MISIVVPCYNEEESLPYFYEKDLNKDDILTKKEIVKEIKKYAVAYRVQARKCYDLKHEKN